MTQSPNPIHQPEAPFDLGPWVCNEVGNVHSEDFAHDVSLMISGDFATKEERKRYGLALAAKLNACPAAAPQASAIPVQQVEQRQEAGRVEATVEATAASEALEAARASIRAEFALHFPLRKPEILAEQQGLFQKFIVRRTDGRDEPGCKHENCEYFVLDVDHDEHARAALAAYADACEKTHPELAIDLRGRYGLATPPQAPGTAAEAVATILRGGTKAFGRACVLQRWEAGAESLSAGEHKLYAAPQARSSAPPLTVYLDEEMSGLLRQTIGDDGDPNAIRLEVGDGHSGWGLYVSLAEYPEEGAIQLAPIGLETKA